MTRLPNVIISHHQGRGRIAVHEVVQGYSGPLVACKGARPQDYAYRETQKPVDCARCLAQRKRRGHG